MVKARCRRMEAYVSRCARFGVFPSPRCGVNGKLNRRHACRRYAREGMRAALMGMIVMELQRAARSRG